jgi:hypothetical protein
LKIRKRKLFLLVVTKIINFLSFIKRGRIADSSKKWFWTIMGAENRVATTKAFKHPKSVLSYFERIGAEVLHFRRAMVKIHKGSYYIERALIKINADGTVSSSVKEFAPTDSEAEMMMEDLKGVEFPKTITAKTTDGLKRLVKGEIYSFTDRRNGEITMVQERRMSANGLKNYIPWVFLSSGDWVAMEPEGDLPFFKPRESRSARIMIHEGAKAADYAEKIATGVIEPDHPWREELAGYEHWGMIGGALAPHRSDYEELRRESPTEVVYVCDNDAPGTSALQKVSKGWGKSLKGILFGKRFPPSWDMADKMPVELFQKGRYIGPCLADLLEPATLATEVIPPEDGKKGRSTTVLRSEFAEEWLHCITPEVFVHREWPNRLLTLGEFNSRVSPFSHVDDTGRLLKKAFGSKAAVIKYIPSDPPGIYAGSKSGMYINTFAPSTVVAEKGDVTPWLDFMETMIPDEGDREEILRWCATLIARPDIRMLYGVLLISEAQGIGKGTLGERILAPLIGELNVSYPSEQEIVDSNFNYWLAHKRLAVVHEIYQGQSSKAYNRLKSIITDKNVTVQKKYQPNYEMENWVHVFACSNSLRAIKLSMDDRRWLVPKLSEEVRPAKFWEQFNTWLSFEGGLQMIKFWAGEFVKKHGAVQRGAVAPWTALKRTIVEENYSPGQNLVVRTLDTIKELVESGRMKKADAFTTDLEMVELIKDTLYDGRHNDKLERPATVRGVAKACGWFIGETKAQVKLWGPSTFGSRVIALERGLAEKSPGDIGGERLMMEERRKPLDLRMLGGM